MDTVKTKVLNIEKRLENLEQHLNKNIPSISKENTIYLTSTEEFGEYNLEDELNAFRFVYAKYENYFEYTLVNPTEKIKSILSDEYGNEENLVLVSYTKDPTKLEEIGYEIKKYPNTSALNNKQNREIIQEELNKYFFRVSDICSCNTRPVNFDQDLTIEFKRKYKMLPHLNIFLTPFDKVDNLSWKIKEMNLNCVTLTFTFPLITGSKLLHYQHRGNKYTIPKGLKMHYYIRGIPDEQEVNLLEN